MAACLVAAGPTLATPSEAQMAEAKQHYAAASKLYDLAEYEGALREFKEAYRAVEDPAFCSTSRSVTASSATPRRRSPSTRRTCGAPLTRPTGPRSNAASPSSSARRPPRPRHAGPRPATSACAGPVSAGDFFGASTQGSASVNTITSAISIAAWIVPQGGAVRTIVSRVINAGFWRLGLADTGALRFTAGMMAAQAPSATGDGSQWVHVAAIYDGAAVRLYVGGALVAQSVFGAVSLVGGPTSGASGGYGIDVGGAYDDINAYLMETYKGRVDELAIYNRALTPGEVDALAHGALPARR